MDKLLGFSVVFVVAFATFSLGCKGDLATNAECVPDCSGKSCGTDGCGGVCGVCGPGLACTQEFECVASGCGNGRVDRNETCDIGIGSGEEGACPEECPDDGNSCTEVQLFGNPQDCDVECRNFVTVACVDGDECCPEGCTPSNDADCSENCGNGVIDEGETCDPPDTCPSPEDCDDGDACTMNMVTGSVSSCSAACASIEITECIDDDGCCPSGCDGSMDNDCDATCGDGMVSGGETCDNAIPAGEDGACVTDPSDCDDGDACTTNMLAGDSDTCSAECVDQAITACVDDDGCCPPTCTPDNDNDCTAVCDNGVVEPGEECDPISSCPTACDDGDACTTDTLLGDAQQCTAVCQFDPITACTGGDGCCPDTCTVAMDSDCQDTCDTYCALALSECSDGDAIYTDMAECMTACSTIPVGVDGDTSGNTVHCRIGYLNMADMDAATYCPYGAADGGAMCI